MKCVTILFIFYLAVNSVKTQQPVVEECPEACKNQDVYMSNDKVKITRD